MLDLKKDRTTNGDSKGSYRNQVLSRCRHGRNKGQCISCEWANARLKYLATRWTRTLDRITYRNNATNCAGGGLKDG